MRVLARCAAIVVTTGLLAAGTARAQLASSPNFALDRLEAGGGGATAEQTSVTLGVSGLAGQANGSSGVRAEVGFWSTVSVPEAGSSAGAWGAATALGWLRRRGARRRRPGRPHADAPRTSRR